MKITKRQVLSAIDLLVLLNMLRMTLFVFGYPIEYTQEEISMFAGIGVLLSGLCYLHLLNDPDINKTASE